MNLCPAHALIGRRSFRAFTLVELLTTISVVSILLAVLLPALGSARFRATEAHCLANARSASMAIVQYSLEARDYVPFGGRTERTVHAPDGRPYEIGGEDGLAKGRWSLLLEHGWHGRDWESAYQCPEQPAYDPSVTDISRSWLSDGYLQTPMFSMSRAFWLDPRSLSSGERTPRKVRPAKLSDVMFPSHKALLYEEIAFCARGPDALWAINVWGQTPYHQSSVVTADGAGLRMKRADGLEASFTWPFDATIDGVFGRDVPR